MSERGFWRAGVAYSWSVFVPDTDGITGKTGLLDASFTKQLLLNDANNATAVTVTEIDAANEPGWYKVTYTPGSAGHWLSRVFHATYLKLGWVDEIQADGTVGIDWGNVANSFTAVDLSNTSLAFLSGADPGTAFSRFASQSSVQSQVSFLPPGALIFKASASSAAANQVTYGTSPFGSTDYYKDYDLLYVKGSNFVPKLCRVTAYDGATKILTVEPAFSGFPQINDIFLLIPPTAARVWQVANAIDGTLTPEKVLTYIFAAVAGVSAGEPSTNPATFKGPSGTVRVSTTYDANNNRTGVVLA